MASAITNADIEAINSRQYDIFHDNVNWGPTIEGGTNVPLESVTTDVDNSEQFEGIISSNERAITSSPITLEMLRADFEQIRTKILVGRVNVETDGINTNFKTGTKKRNLRQLAKN